MPPSNSPVTDLTSPDMACNVPGTLGTTVPASEGDAIRVQWTQSGHPGPITHFLLAVDDAATATGAGAGWFKIDEEDNVGGVWAADRMGKDDMMYEFKLPVGLASGEYLLRSEMLALHSSQEKGGAQFYVGEFASLSFPSSFLLVFFLPLCTWMVYVWEEVLIR
jgi:cellulase